MGKFQARLMMTSYAAAILLHPSVASWRDANQSINPISLTLS